MRRLLPLLLIVLAAGCPYVPEGEIRADDGALPIAPGAAVQLSLYCDPLFGGWELAAGADRCGRDWQVQEQPGGSVEYGTITPCGLYRAPIERPPEPPVILASECDWGGHCADACGAYLTLTLDRYTDP